MQFRMSIPKKSTFRAKKPLELIQTNFYGPVKQSSLSKSNSSFSSLMIIQENMGIVLKGKLETFNMLKSLKHSKRKIMDANSRP